MSAVGLWMVGLAWAAPVEAETLREQTLAWMDAPARATAWLRAGPKESDCAAADLWSLASAGRSRSVRRGVKKHLEAWPGHVDEAAVLWRVEGWGVGQARAKAVQDAAARIGEGSVEDVYRAWRLMILVKEEDLGLAAAARLSALGEEVPVAGRLPWGDAMVRDLARTLQSHAFPQIPERATRSEETRIWAALVRGAQQAEDLGRVADLRDQALARGVVVEIEEWTRRSVAPFPLEVDGASLAVGSGAPPVLVVLWASWCAPCHSQLPELAQWVRAREGAQSGYKVVAVSIDAKRDDAERDWSDMELAGLSWAWSPGLERVLGVSGIPAIVLVDEEGVILMERRGYKEGEILELDEVLPRLLE